MGCKNCNKKMKIFKWKYMKNFLKFLFANIKSGFQAVSFKEYQNRQAICRGCMYYDITSNRCIDCGCWIENKAKWKSEDCPQNFWKKIV